MKKYPRIYSLSTIGIIHHQKNDYIFHPYCTDFIGDSDSGKSIIADLLQLIFVGSSVFRSATIPVKDRREPDGDRKSTRLNSSHSAKSRMPSSA